MKNRKILLIEDNASDIELTRRALEKNNIGHTLVVIEDGQEALDYLFGTGLYADRQQCLLPGLILLDLNLPTIDGLTILRRLRNDPHTRRQLVVILTTSTEQTDLQKAYDLGVNSYLRKPVDYSRFEDIVVQLGKYWLDTNESPSNGYLT